MVAQTKGSVVYYVNNIAVTDPSIGSYQPIDADTYGVAAEANGLFLQVFTNSKVGPMKFRVRHADATGDFNGDLDKKHHTNAPVGLRDDNVWDEFMEETKTDVLIAAYTKFITGSGASLTVHADVDMVGTPGQRHHPHHHRRQPG